MTRLSVMVIGTLSFPVLFGCSRTMSGLRIYAVSSDQRLLYEDTANRPTRWAAKGGALVAVAESVPRRPRIYEPYPMLESFMAVAVTARTDDAGDVTGTLLLKNGRHSEAFTVEALACEASHAGEAEIRASNPDRTAVLRIRGEQGDFAKLKAEVDSLLAREW